MENIPVVLKHPCGSTLYGIIIGSGPAAGKVHTCYTQETVARDLLSPPHTGYGKADIEAAGYVLTPLTRID